MKLTVINEENVNACVHIPPIYIAPNQPLNAHQDYIGAKGAEDDKLRITFDLKFARQLFSDYRIVSLPIQHTFNDTTLDKLTAE